MMHPTQKNLYELSLLLHNDINKMQVVFDSPVQVKTTPHNLIGTYGGVATDKELRVWVRRIDGSWNELKPNQVYVEYVIASLRQRLKLMYPKVMIATYDNNIKATIIHS